MIHGGHVVPGVGIGLRRLGGRRGVMGMVLRRSSGREAKQGGAGVQADAKMDSQYGLLEQNH